LPESDALERFTWPIHDAGYEIVVKRPEPVPAVFSLPLIWGKDWGPPYKSLPINLGERAQMIVPKRPLSSSAYYPLDKEHSALFQEFASTPPTDAGVLAFANRYGLLGLNYFPGQRSRPAAEDSLELWKHHIRALKFLMARFVRFSRMFDGLPYPAEVRDLCERINTELRARVVQRTWFEDDRVLMGPIPVSLMGALWLQAAWGMSRRAIYRNCRFCSKSFEVATGQSTGKRADAEHCGPNCRLGTMRLRDRIEKLRANGFSWNAIALQLQRPIKSVREIARPNVVGRRRH
jgi:hypothetical protein